MIREIDPISLQEELRDRVRRYLMTTLPISGRFPNLRKEAEAYLNREDVLIKGPFLEALPDFPKGSSLKDLVKEGVLHSGFSDLEENVYERPLHTHQEKALRQIIVDKRNTIVATGTGSGKTECFVYPMVNRLLELGVKGKPGIRAIIVYPLNALANDQLYQRLAPDLAGRLAEHGITLGRYTGQTKSREDRKTIADRLMATEEVQKHFSDGIPSTWLLSRAEMKATPPHVLVTNYAMLEHLLLLPSNRSLFNNADLQMLILDEIHTYQGTQATEVAMLMRKLKNRYGQGRGIRCIGTSASLSSDPSEAAKVSEFAGNLFDSEFSLPINATRKRHHLLDRSPKRSGLSVEQWIRAHELLLEVRETSDSAESIAHWNDRMIEEDIEFLIEPESDTLASALCSGLAADPMIQKLADLLESEKGTILLVDLASRIFCDEATANQRLEAVRAMVTLGAYARESENGYPLLPARYHIFVRGVEEATIELVTEAESAEHGINFRFRKEYQDTEKGKPRYKMLTCRKCGELYFEAWEKSSDQRIESEYRRGLSRKVFWLKGKDTLVGSTLESNEEEDADREHSEECYVHPSKGQVLAFMPDDEDSSQWLHTFRAEMKSVVDDMDQSRNLVTTCHSCGGFDRNEIVTPFHPGDQALSGMISDVFFDALPKKEQEKPVPGDGRSLLVFSDNRQDAAFFAPNLQRSHEEILLRWKTVELLKKADGRETLHNLAIEMSENRILRRGFLDEEGKPLNADTAPSHFGALMLSEFCTPGGSRSSLEDLGIVEVKYTADFGYIARAANMGGKLGLDVVRFVYDLIRGERAVTLPPGIKQTSDFYWGPYAQENRYFMLDEEKHRFKLIPKTTRKGNYYVNRTYHVLKNRLGLENWREILCDIWRVLRTDIDESRMSFPHEDKRKLQINHKSIRLVLPDDDTPVYRCNSCSAVSRWSLAGICTKWKCEGEMKPLSKEEWGHRQEKNHYNVLYQRKEKIPSLLAREHTAALSVDLKEKIEGEFKRGELNVLSCTTTMEMGIDLGDLSGVMLRNVPPGIANYQQRAGRAGRRGQGAPVSLTYARNRRFDQTRFEEANEFLKSPPKTPFVHLSNTRILRRHQYSLLLASLLESLGLEDVGLQIGELFGLPKIQMSSEGLKMDTPQGFDETDAVEFNRRVLNWANSRSAVEAIESSEQLQEQVLRKDSDFSKERLKIRFLEDLAALAEQFSERYSYYWMRAEDNRAERKDRAAGYYADQAYRFANQQLINYLSKNGIIPSYTFPVDNIELEVLGDRFQRRGERDVELVRDARIGIVEYAPGSEIVANGRVWISRGIEVGVRDHAPIEFYKICRVCQHLQRALDPELLPLSCDACNADLSKEPLRKYQEPKSFLTSVNEKEGKEPGRLRVKSPPALEQKLIGNAPEEAFSSSDLSAVSWAYQDSKRGRMVVINQGKGRGFHVCRSCCASQAVSLANQRMGPHANPKTGLQCDGGGKSSFTNKIDLAHTFNTDVLQTRISTNVFNLFNSTDHFQLGLDGIEKVARTVAEAIRVGAVELLSIPDSELTATYRWFDVGLLEVILSDSVPGGAGYVGELKRLNAIRLFESARDALSCPHGCTSGCSACLRSYSNQFHWESFLRQPALHFVETVLSICDSDILSQVGAVELTSKQLNERLDTASEIVWLSRRLGQFSGALEPDASASGQQQDTDGPSREAGLEELFVGASRLKRWLAAGKKVSLLASKCPDFKAMELPRARRFAEQFLGDIRSGMLEVSNSLSTSNLSNLPMVVFREKGADSWSVVYCPQSSPSLIDSLRFPEPSRLIVDAAKNHLEFMDSVSALPLTSFESSSDRIERIQLDPGRDCFEALEGLFEALSEEKADEILIADRYLVATDGNREAFEFFIDGLAGVAGARGIPAPSRMRLLIGPTDRHNQKSMLERCEKLERYLKKHDYWKTTELQRNLRSNARGGYRDYHDRRIEIKLTPKGRSKKSRKLQVEMTGGIDILMDNREKTRVYIFKG